MNLARVKKLEAPMPCTDEVGTHAQLKSQNVAEFRRMPDRTSEFQLDVSRGFGPTMRTSLYALTFDWAAPIL